MPTWMLLFCLLCVTSSNLSSALEDNCKTFSTTLPNMLRELRAAFSSVKTYFQTRDKLETKLIDKSLLEELKSYLGCQALSEMIKFYLEEVMPRAEENELDVKEDVGSLGEKLKALRLRLKRCHRFLPCEDNSRVVKQVRNTYKELQEQGVYKAMGDFDIFIGYMEEYLTMHIGK
uniref:Interleukin-10 n=2 Tax=Trichosurus vulpecula TaxID=9337 RepID=IL10_TRIVU|nr:RecName: Full=Interleukin-10; Short=IL-10; AltName: Full=Cytokine synthesis inhibitory factor; Short=CSIF; Flags: Precursor [Trichosurus vulpecula]AAD01799.1 interleukin-10 [Trichosurus vulpecula]